jgi:hypothetical protein
MTGMTEREQLQAMVEELPDEEVHAALRFVSYLRVQQDPLLAALAAAPLDDEEVTEEDRAALREAEADLAAGRTVSTEQLRRRLAVNG